MKIWVKRAPIALGAAVACSLALTSCGAGSQNSANAAMTDFANAIARQDVNAAAGETTAPSQAGDFLGSTLRAMHAQHIDVDVHNPVVYSDGTASFALTTKYSWDKGRNFETTTSGTARKLSSGWKVQWEPNLVYTGLSRNGQLREVRTDATPAPRVLSRSGKTFMYVQPVNDIVLDPSKTADLPASVAALVRTIAPIAPLVTADVINGKLAKNPGAPVTAVTLRDPDMAVLAGNPAAVNGVAVDRRDMLVMADRRLNSPLEVGLTNYWNAIRDATAGWQVQVVEPGQKPLKLAGEQGPAGKDVPTSVDQNVQLSLGDAAVEVAQPATILALDATTGGILGMARNDAATARRITLDQPFPVGTTLNDVFTAVNRTATATQVSTDTLLDRLGLGVSLTVPGASSPSTGRNVGTIDFQPSDYRATMLNMAALGVAMARSGDGSASSVAPYVINGTPTKVADGALGGIDAGLANSILGAMTTVAKTGDASDLRGAPGLRALVGTNGPHGPGWFLGVQDHKVIVVYTEGDKSGTAALQVAQKYFTIK